MSWAKMASKNAPQETAIDDVKKGVGNAVKGGNTESKKKGGNGKTKESNAAPLVPVATQETRTVTNPNPLNCFFFY